MELLNFCHIVLDLVLLFWPSEVTNSIVIAFMQVSADYEI